MPSVDDVFIAAADGGDLDGVRRALEMGANVHADNDYALRWAASRGQLNIVQCLLAAGADLSANYGAPLRWAAKDGHVPVVLALRRAGAGLRDLSSLWYYAPAIQCALLSEGEVDDLDPIAQAEGGLSPGALSILLVRKGQPEIAAMLTATGMLDTLEPAARATTLAGLLQATDYPEPSVRSAG